MRELAIHLWPSLAIAGLIGFVLTLARGRFVAAGRWPALVLGVIVLAAASMVSWLGYVPGRAGLWLDSAVLHGAAYLCGGCAGALIGMLWQRLHRPAVPAA